MDVIETSESVGSTLCCDEARAYALRAGGDVERRLERALEPTRALLNPKRVRIVAALQELGELCVGDAALIGDTSVALASHHLAALHDAGIVERRRQGKLMMYRLSEHGTQLVGSLLKDTA